MTFQRTLQGTYDKIVNQPAYATAISIQAIVVANARRFVGQKVVYYDIFESYIDKFAADRFIGILFDLITIRDHILPHIDSLYIELHETSRDKATGKDVGVTKITKYQAFAINPPKMEMNTDDKPSGMTELEQMGGFVEMDFQLVEIPVMYLRLYEYSGMYPNLSGANFLRYAFNEALNDVMKKVAPGVTPKLDMVPPSNPNPTTNVIKSRKRLMELPEYIQQKVGVYTTGIGRFFKENVMYLYPPFHAGRYKTTKARLNVVSLPNNGRPPPDLTYLLNGEEVTILTAGNVEIFNKSEESARNLGTGVRYTRASTLIDGMASGSANKASANFSTTNVAKALETKPDGLTSATRTVITDNPYRELSAISQGLGFNIGLQWSHSNEKLIYPAMPVRFSFNHGTDIISYYGTVTGVRTSYRASTNQLHDRTMIRDSQLTLFVKK